jgi:hypothetical protein
VWRPKRKESGNERGQVAISAQDLQCGDQREKGAVM